MLVAKFFASRFDEVPRHLVTNLERRFGLQAVVTWITQVISSNLNLDSFPTRLVTIAALLRRYSPSPHSLLRSLRSLSHVLGHLARPSSRSNKVICHRIFWSSTGNLGNRTKLQSRTGGKHSTGGWPYGIFLITLTSFCRQTITFG
jgi:hypothetical protein